MKIQITVPVVNDEKVFKKSLLIEKFNTILSEFDFKNNLIDRLEISILMVFTEGGNFEMYKDWYKLKKIKYNDSDKSLHYEFFLENEKLEEFISVSDEKSLDILAYRVAESLSNIDKLPAKIKGFNLEQFKKNIQLFLDKKQP